jgi:hypothetical protein
MMLELPAAIAVTTPVEGSTVATFVALLLQAPVPPLNTAEVALYVAVAPIHKGVVPVTEPALALAYVVTVTGVRVAEGQVVPVAVQVMIT